MYTLKDSLHKALRGCSPFLRCLCSLLFPPYLPTSWLRIPLLAHPLACLLCPHPHSTPSPTHSHHSLPYLTHLHVLNSNWQMMPELGFGPEDNDRLVASYSGGWQMRMCLGKILLKVG